MAISTRFRRGVLGLTAALLLMGSVLVQPAAAARSRVAVDADLSCVSGGGASISYTLTNTGKQTVHLGDLHFYLTRMTKGGPKGAGIVFLFPSPDFAVIPAGESRTWLVDIGTGIPGEPGSGTDLSARRLMLETEAWMDGYETVRRRTFTFPGCNGWRTVGRG